ncbi:family 1 glycosylhydrolase [Roseibacillus persicicus]|uniref:family 1 glycosylhydrolase n=1 Tax=Roseibacillus persicicus TaxID=454148 RepID=UPI00280E8A60|nr:family 1 glycosylhydrolase [Roseibacillus persicicus]MDQ8189960.1 family 1 glycosylhydrolase [Roseibacillus persicicus]
MEFPPNFLFGVANADHQVEAHDPEREDVWDLWERSQNLTPRKRAVDFWNRYPEDIDHAAEMGCKLFRFSIAWARVQPSADEWDEDAIQHYRELAEYIRDKGMKVMITLVHFTWPVWVEREGGLIGPDFPDRFADYAEKMAHHFGDIADYWVTFNEPTQLVYGFIKPWWQNNYYMPPGLPEGTGANGEAEAIGKLVYGLFSAHARARVRIKGLDPKAKVGVNPLVTGFPPWLQKILDHQLHTQWLLKATYRFSMAEPLIAGKGKVDLVIGGINAESHANLTFSDPYVVTGKAVMTLNDGKIGELSQLANCAAGFVGPAVDHALAATHLPESCHLSAFASYAEGRKALRDGTIRALYGDELLLMPQQLENKEDFRLLISGLTRETHSIGMPLGHNGVLALLNRVIADFNCEQYGACSPEKPDEPHLEPMPPVSLADYFANDSLPGPRKLIDGEGIRRIRRRGHLKVGIHADAPGICPSCPEDGVEVELVRSVAEALLGDREKVEFVTIDPTKPLKVLETRASRLNLLWRFAGAAGLIANSNWWYLGIRGRLPESLCPAEAHRAQDFVGVDYYWGLPTTRLHQFNRLVEAGEGRFLNAPVWPEGLGHALRRYHRWFPDQEIMIIENGCVPMADGVTRQEYLRAHLAEISKVCQEGVPVTGYLCWSLTSNREWGHAFNHQTDFGLYHVALETDPDLKRVPSKEVGFYKDIIAAHAAHHRKEKSSDS